MNKVSAKDVSEYFAKSSVLEHYQEATSKVGLWNSEKIVFTQTFDDKNCNLLELGCGTGRISFGLWKLGYRIKNVSDGLEVNFHEITQKVCSRIHNKCYNICD